MITTPHGEQVTVRRRWLPWEKKIKGEHIADAPGVDLGGGMVDDVGFGDDPISAAIGAVLLVIVAFFLLPFLIIAIGFALELFLLVLLLPIFIPLRSVLIPWELIVREKSGGVLHTESVKGWFASRRRLTELREELALYGLAGKPLFK